jgi:hypothetical protein
MEKLYIINSKLDKYKNISGDCKYQRVLHTQWPSFPFVWEMSITQFNLIQLETPQKPVLCDFNRRFDYNTFPDPCSKVWMDKGCSNMVTIFLWHRQKKFFLIPPVEFVWLREAYKYYSFFFDKKCKG